MGFYFNKQKKHNTDYCSKPRAESKIFKEVSNDPKMPSWDLQVGLATVDVKVHASMYLPSEGDCKSLIFIGGVQ